MYRINMRRLIVFVIVFSILIVCIRGCIFAKNSNHTIKLQKQDTDKNSGPDIILTIYDDEAKQTIEMPMEEYLVGVVAAEMPASFDEQALCAQAVAARTYTVHCMQSGGCRSSGCDICTDSKCCQAYDSDAACREKWGTLYTDYIQKLQTAVQSTQGEVLYYHGTLIEALYHAASGGQTEDSENVFANAQPYLRSVESTNEQGSTYLTDEARFTRKEFAQTVNKNWSKANLSASKLEKQVKIERRYDSGRVETIRLGGVKVSGRDMRTLFSLRSTLFEIKFTDKEVVIKTKGYGHGVGMSQAGANGMAKEGKDYQTILAHYYVGANIGLIDEDQLSLAESS